MYKIKFFPLSEQEPEQFLLYFKFSMIYYNYE